MPRRRRVESVDDIAFRDLHKFMKRETAQIRHFWIMIVIYLLSFVCIFVVYKKIAEAAARRNVPYVFEWFETVQPSSSNIFSNTRDIMDIALASQNPGMHSILCAFGIYETCTRESADFILMTIMHFKERLTLGHWCGSSQLARILPFYFPSMDLHKGEDVQWDAWQRSKDAHREKIQGDYYQLPKNIWYDLFPKSQQAFFMTPVIHEYAHDSNKLDIHSTRLAMLFASGLSGVASISGNYQSPSEMFHDYWVSNAPPAPPSCGNTFQRSIVAGGQLGSNMSMGAMMVAGGPGLVIGQLGGFATGMMSSLFAQDEVCKKEREYQQRTL